MTRLSGFFKHNLSYALLLASVIALVLGIARQTQVFASPPFQAPGGKPGSRLLNSNVPVFTVDLYERTQNCAGCGAPTESPPAVTLPSAVNQGYVVIFENSSGSISNQSSWSDVLAFVSNGCSNSSTTAQLISEGGNFPSVATVQGCPNDTIVETQTGSGNDDADVTVFSSSPHVYNVHSDAPVNEPASDPNDPAPTPVAPKEVPEADTLLLMGGGLGGLATWLGWQWNKRRAKGK
jgi:hypothetical protein